MNKQQVKNNIKRAMGEEPHYTDQYALGRYRAYNNSLVLIDQIEESSVSNETVNDILESNRKLAKRVNELEAKLEEPEQEKVVVNEMMAGHIENCKNLKLTLSDSLHLVVPGDKQKEVLFARAWLDGYKVEPEPKTYRFTLNAYHEIYVTAASFEEAQKEADKTWNQYFVRQRDFGGAEYEGEVEEITK